MCKYCNSDKVLVTVIGGSVIDVLAGPVDIRQLVAGSQPMKELGFSFGGDALNEAVALSRMGVRTDLITKIGQDDSGKRILAYLAEEGIDSSHVIMESGLETAVNIVLFDEHGERYFLTNPNGSLRKLTEEDIYPYLDNAANIVSFASMFVSPPITVDAIARIFKCIKTVPGRILTADMTKAKNGECLEDLKEVLPYVDYIFPNEEEIRLLTGVADPYENAKLLLEAGVGCAVIKRGKKGCLIQTKKELLNIAAYPDVDTVDSTGAGDCFAAGFLYGLSHHMALEECGRIACAAASCSVGAVGAVSGLHSMEAVLARSKKIEVR